jgi:hypothetical protein
MLQVELEPMIPVVKQQNTIHALDDTATQDTTLCTHKIPHLTFGLLSERE